MNKGPDSTDDPIALSVKAIEELSQATNLDSPPLHEPSTPLEAQAAVQRLGEIFNEIPAFVANSLGAARDSAAMLSSDRLQGLAEIVQNADDVEASQVRVLLRPHELLVSHDGNPVRLAHLLALATPWLTTKGDETGTTGRFGIGLATLSALSRTVDIHCDPYHVRIGDPTISWVDPTSLPGAIGRTGWTTLLVPLAEGALSEAELEEWLKRWDDSSLLFLRRVSKISLVNPQGVAIRELKVSRHQAGEMEAEHLSSGGPFLRERVKVNDARSWVVYSGEVPSPSGVQRAHKATAQATPIAVAFPENPSAKGQIYAGLPVVRTPLRLFANAQFDPLASRQDLYDNEWNQALVSLVAEFWSYAAVDMFTRDPKVAWQAMPIAGNSEDDVESPLVRKLNEAILNRARHWVASHLSFPVAGQGEVPLSQLAVEDQPLETILTHAETAALANLPATLPWGVRDRGGNFRSALDDWRSAGADIPSTVTVETALELVRDESRSPLSTIRLVALGLREGFDERLSKLPCVIAHDGRHIVPPREDSPQAVAADTTPLAKQLGVITLLHKEHLGDDEDARAVLAWLRGCRALLDASDDRVVVRRLAAAGRAKQPIATPLTDEQVRALRDAFELIDPVERQDIGLDVGRAISLEAYVYEAKGFKTVHITPVDAYLPRAIDRETDSFAVAAGNTVGIPWLSNRYSSVLRSPSGEERIGAQRFFGRLGAERAPRLQPHPMLRQRYADRRRGLPASIVVGSQNRTRAMDALDATYTLEDRSCPILTAIAKDIAGLRGKRERRKRAGALLATLGRASDRLLTDFGEVSSARDSGGWQERGKIRAYWLWEAGEIAWLDDESGNPRRPCDLRVRTPASEAIYGKNSPDYLHPDLSGSGRLAVLRALGVAGDPTRSELVERLKMLRGNAQQTDESRDTVTALEAAVVYKALAQSLESATSGSDLSANRLRSEFQNGVGLLLTNSGWHPPKDLLAGPPIFGHYKEFVPAIAGAEPLWTALRLRQPSPEDCLEVIGRIARRRGKLTRSDETIVLETLRVLASHHETGSTREGRRSLARLPLWTGKRWMRHRPVYATSDPTLADRLRDRLPIWEPGGELTQFHSLLGLLHIEEIRAADLKVVKPELSKEDIKATALFRLAIEQLQDDLARNEPELAQGMKISWDSLGQFRVHLHPSLALNIVVGGKGAEEEYEIQVPAKMDPDLAIMFVQSTQDVPSVAVGGRALAALFGGDPRRIAQAWRAAYDRAELGFEVQRVELAQEQAEREQQEYELALKMRMEAIRERTATKHRTTPPSGRPGIAAVPSGNGGDGGSEEQPAPSGVRRLVNVESLIVLDPRGQVTEGTRNAIRKRESNTHLREPTQPGRSPLSKTPRRDYTDLEKETVGYELALKLLSSDQEKMVDLRAQRGIGADAMDHLRTFYEWKVSAGPEPDEVTLTNAEVKRALSTEDFFLVVVSGVEGVDAQPKVRVILDPLKQLTKEESGSITLSGVRAAKSLVYNFVHDDGHGGSIEEQPRSEPNSPEDT